MLDHLSHGGRLADYAAASGIPADRILDFSANINPLGSPPWLDEAVAEGRARIGSYPDPLSRAAREAGAARFACDPERFLFADGADSLIFAAPLALGAASCVLFSPGYAGYSIAARRAGLEPTLISLDEEKGFIQDLALVRAVMKGLPSPTLVFVGSPNNPAGGSPDPRSLLDIALSRPGDFFLVDESFAELAGQESGLVADSPPNIVVARSLTKTFAVPGARVGYLAGAPRLLAKIRAELPAWPLSSFGEAIAIRALADRRWPSQSATLMAESRRLFVARLEALPGLRVFPGPANFLLVKLDFPAEPLAAELLKRGIAVRIYRPEEGLDGRWMRLAVRSDADNRILLEGLREILAGEEARRWIP